MNGLQGHSRSLPLLPFDRPHTTLCLKKRPPFYFSNNSVKVIWEEGRVAAKVSPHCGTPQIRPKSIPSRGLILKPNYVPHPWTRPTYDAKRHPDPIRRFSIMHWTDRRTDRQIVHGKV